MKICEECNDVFKFRRSASGAWRSNCGCPDYADFVPSPRATIIVPSRYLDIFADCRDSLDRYAPKEHKILVRDGNSIDAPSGWTTIQGPDSRFVYSRNINLGITASTGDVLLTNDDVRFTHPRTLEIMQAVMARHPDVGILSPLIKGDVGEYWQGHATKTLHLTDVRLCFVCVLIKREVLDKIGLLDERFTGYGYDDVDYSRRVVDAGYKLGVTGRAVVTHGHGEERCSTSYRREVQTMGQLDHEAKLQYRSKWGDEKLDFPKE